ncbi:hypothetical protein A8B76_11385 [Roseovarius indicus]|nr:hypothetical protein A8B76_11385 [Roseovarius indicus]
MVRHVRMFLVPVHTKQLLAGFMVQSGCSPPRPHGRSMQILGVDQSDQLAHQLTCATSLAEEIQHVRRTCFIG